MKNSLPVFLACLLSFATGTTIEWRKCLSEDQFCFGISHYNNRTSFDGDFGCLARYDCTVFVVGTKDFISGTIQLTYAYNFMMIEDLEFEFTMTFNNDTASGNQTSAIGLETSFHRESIMARFAHYMKIQTDDGNDVVLPPSKTKLNHKFMFFQYDLEEQHTTSLTDIPVDIVAHLHGNSSARRSIDVVVSESNVVLFGKNKTLEVKRKKKTEHSELPWWSVIILLVFAISITICLVYFVDSTNEKTYKSKTPRQKDGEIKSEESLYRPGKISIENSFVSKSESSGRIKPIKV